MGLIYYKGDKYASNNQLIPSAISINTEQAENIIKKPYQELLVDVDNGERLILGDPFNKFIVQGIRVIPTQIYGTTKNRDPIDKESLPENSFLKLVTPDDLYTSCVIEGHNVESGGLNKVTFGVEFYQNNDLTCTSNCTETAGINYRGNYNYSDWYLRFTKRPTYYGVAWWAYSVKYSNNTYYPEIGESTVVGNCIQCIPVMVGFDDNGEIMSAAQFMSDSNSTNVVTNVNFYLELPFRNDAEYQYAQGITAKLEHITYDQYMEYLNE